MPMYMDEIYQKLERADLFLSIGTSGLVYPAAGFVQAVAPHCRTIECNLKGTVTSGLFQEHVSGPASLTVREILSNLIK
jgi:NAD-dependent deacetylase